MASVNKTILLGHVGKDPDVKTTTSGEVVVNFSLATSESWKDQAGAKHEKTEWHRCVAWRKLADIISQYVHKGSLIFIEGRLQTRSWEKDGKKNYVTEIVVDKLQMLDGKGAATKQDDHGGGEPDGDSLPF